MLLRSHRTPLQRGRHRRHCRPQRLRQEQHQRRHQLGAGRAVRQEPARHPHGRRDLRRNPRPQAARHGLRHHDAGRPRGLQRERGRTSFSQWKTASPPQSAEDHHHAPPLPLGRKRIPDRRPHRPPARHSGPLHGHRPRARKLRHHRAGPHRPDPQLQAAGPPLRHRRGRRHHQVQDPQAPRRSQAGRRQAEPGARVTTSWKKSPAR